MPFALSGQLHFLLLRILETLGTTVPRVGQVSMDGITYPGLTLWGTHLELICLSSSKMDHFTGKKESPISQRWSFVGLYFR